MSVLAAPLNGSGVRRVDVVDAVGGGVARDPLQVPAAGTGDGQQDPELANERGGDAAGGMSAHATPAAMHRGRQCTRKRLGI